MIYGYERNEELIRLAVEGGGGTSAPTTHHPHRRAAGHDDMDVTVKNQWRGFWRKGEKIKPCQNMSSWIFVEFDGIQ